MEKETGLAAKQTQADFAGTIKPLLEALNAKKSVSMTLPDGRTASAEVTPQ